MSAPLGQCPFCKSDLRVNSFSKRIGKACPHVFETAQIKCKRQSCGFSGPLIKGENSRAHCIESWVAWNRRTDLSQASVAAALEAAAARCDEHARHEVGREAVMLKSHAAYFRSMITPDQRTALQAAIDAAKAEERAEDAAKIAELVRLVKLLPRYIPAGVVECRGDKCREPWCVSCYGDEHADDAITQARADMNDVTAALAQIGAKP